MSEDKGFLSRYDVLVAVKCRRCKRKIISDSIEDLKMDVRLHEREHHDA